MAGKKQQNTKKTPRTKKKASNGENNPKNRESQPASPNITDKLPTEDNNSPQNSENLPETIKNTNLIEYDNTIEKLFNDIDLPEDISPQKGKKSKYTPQLAVNLLVDIATDGSRTIEQIANDCGIAGKTVHLWGLYSDMFLQGYHRAQEMRQDAKIRDLERLETEMDTYIDNEENDTREKGIRIQRYRTRALSRQWEASRLNKRYQEKSESTITTVDHADLRAQAWELHNPPKEIPHEVIPNETQPSNNDTQPDPRD